MRRICALTAVALLISSCLSSASMAANSVFLLLWRADDFSDPSAQFKARIDVDLSSVIGVTEVTVSIGSFAVYPLVYSGGGEWKLDDDIPFANLNAMKSALDGTWTIDVAGSSPSRSTFALTTTGLDEGDFYPTPTGLSPADGATDVSADTAISWVDPTGTSTPYVLHLWAESEDAGISQEALSLLGEIDLAATLWQPPSALSPGSNEVAVSYADHDQTLTGSLSVPLGSITWSASPFGPPGYPDATPLILKGSETVVQFMVPEPSARAAAGAALGTLLLLARFQRRCAARS